MSARVIALAVLFVTATAAVSLPVFAESTENNSPADRIHNHSPLVTGNGFGFAVVNGDGEVVKLYAHPYRFERPNADITKDGPSTPSLVKSFRRINGYQHKPDVSYVSQSHIISAKVAIGRSISNANHRVDHSARGGDGIVWDEVNFFMPFGLKRNVLIAIGPPPFVPIHYGERPPEFEVAFALPVNSHP